MLDILRMPPFILNFVIFISFLSHLPTYLFALIQMAIDYGTDKEDQNIWTASSDGDLDAVRRYIETLGVDPNTQDEFGYNPLAAAVSYQHVALVNYLLDKGANVNLLDSDGESPIFYCESREMAEILVQHGADLHVKNLEGQTLLDRAEEDAAGLPSDLVDYYVSLGIERAFGCEEEDEESGDDETE